MRKDLSVLKIVSTCIVISLSFVLLAFSLIGMLTNVHAAIASPTGHPSLASLPTTPIPTSTPTHKHKHTLIPSPTATTQAIATPTALPALTTNNSMTPQDFRSPFISALLGTLISAGVTLFVSIVFLRILRWRQLNKSSRGNRDKPPLIESQATLPFNDIFLPTDDTPAPTNQTAFNNVFLPTNGPLDPAHQPQISFSDMFLPTDGPFDPAHQPQISFSDMFLPTNGAPVPTHQPQISFSDMFLPTNGAPVPTHQPQTASNDMFPSDPRNLPTHS